MKPESKVHNSSLMTYKDFGKHSVKIQIKWHSITLWACERQAYVVDDVLVSQGNRSWSSSGWFPLAVLSALNARALAQECPPPGEPTLPNYLKFWEKVGEAEWPSPKTKVYWAPPSPHPRPGQLSHQNKKHLSLCLLLHKSWENLKNQINNKWWSLKYVVSLLGCRTYGSFKAEEVRSKNGRKSSFMATPMRKTRYFLQN